MGICSILLNIRQMLVFLHCKIWNAINFRKHEELVFVDLGLIQSYLYVSVENDLYELCHHNSMFHTCSKN